MEILTKYGNTYKINTLFVFHYIYICRFTNNISVISSALLFFFGCFNSQKIIIRNGDKQRRGPDSFHPMLYFQQHKKKGVVPVFPVLVDLHGPYFIEEE